MSLLWIIALVLVLYLQTIRYNYVIDDNVKRSGYLYDVPMESPPANFHHTRPSVWYRLFMIGMHCVNVTIIYMLWGWGPALLYAVHPQCVWGVAWVTGNYYATATYFTLISYFILHTFPNMWGALVAMPIFAAALNSTVDPITFPFLMFFSGNPWALSLFLPLITFLKGKKFTTGLKIRHSFHMNKGKIVDTSFTWRRIFLMTKVTARYVYLALVPDKIGFFSKFGRDLRDDKKRYDRMHSVNGEFWYSLLLCLTVLVLGLMVNPFGILWFFAAILLHSQWNMTGQFLAQRYLYFAIVGLCIVFGQLLQPYPIILTIVATALFIRAFIFVPVWRSMESIWRNDVETYPDYGLNYNNLAQFYMNNNVWNIPHRVNEIAWLMAKAMHLDGNQWEVHMNQACMYASLGRVDAALEETNVAISLLEPLGGISYPLDKLKEQRIKLEGLLNEKSKNISTNPDSTQVS